MVNIICGSYLNLEAGLNLKYYFASLGCSLFSYSNEYFTQFDFRFYFLLNQTLFFLKKCAKLF